MPRRGPWTVRRCLDVATAAVLFVAPDAAAQDATVAFVNATVVDVERGVLVPRQTILTSRGRIDQVGPVSTTTVPRGATRVDVAGRFVIPGLWDMHVHIAEGESVDALVGYYGSLFLANGVTGVRDGGSHAVRIAAMDSIGRTRPGSMPRLVFAGEKVGPAPGESWSADDVRRAIASRIQDGVHYIKLKPGFPAFLLPTALEACASARLLCVSHIPSADTAVWLSARGRGSFEHLFNLSDRLSRVPASQLSAEMREYENPKFWQRVAYKLRLRTRPQDPRLRRIAVRDTSKDREFFTRIASSGTWFTPTLSLHNQISPAIALPTYAVDSTLARMPVVWNPGPTPADVVATRQDWQISTGLLRAMHAAGVRMLAGTDFTGRHVPGAVLHGELTLLQQEGIPAAEVLRMATLYPARYFGTVDSSGTVAAGRVADLVVLRANPLDDVRNVSSIDMVMARGHLLRRAALDSMTNKARAALIQLRAATAPRGPGDH
jgi:amidohydrolase family protein